MAARRGREGGGHDTSSAAGTGQTNGRRPEPVAYTPEGGLRVPGRAGLKLVVDCGIIPVPTHTPDAYPRGLKSPTHRIEQQRALMRSISTVIWIIPTCP